MYPSNSKSQLPHDINILEKKVILSITEIDEIIIENINKATAENSKVWTSPDYNRREYTHSFFQYPARMIPAVQKKLIEIITQAKTDITNMIDPFMGSATTLVTCMERGLNCYGQDINPLSILIANVRTGPYQISNLKGRYDVLIHNVENDKDETIEANFKTLNKWFKSPVVIQLSKLTRQIRKEPQLHIRRFFWVVLAETIRVSSNDRTSTYKLHIRTHEQINKRDFSAIDVFDLHISKCIEDFKFHSNLLEESGQLINEEYKCEIDIRLCDSKKSIYTPVRRPFYDLLVTSPPYGDNKTTVTYGQNSFLPLQWIDLDDIDLLATKDYLKTTSEIDSRSLGGKIKNIDTNALENLFEISPTFRNVYTAIKSVAPKKVNKVAAFAIDLNTTIDNIFKVMRIDSYQIWTVGNRSVANTEIPNDEIIKELITSKGGMLITKVEREIINKRMAKRNKDTSLMNTEDILIFRKIG